MNSPRVPRLTLAQTGCIIQLDLYRVALPLVTPLVHSQVDTAVLDELFLVLTLTDGTEGSSEVRGTGLRNRSDAAAVSLRSRSAPLLIESGADHAATTGRAPGLATAGSSSPRGAAVDALARASALPLWRFLGKKETPILRDARLDPLLRPRRGRETSPGRQCRRVSPIQDPGRGAGCGPRCRSRNRSPHGRSPGEPHTRCQWRVDDVRCDRHGAAAPTARHRVAGTTDSTW